MNTPIRRNEPEFETPPFLQSRKDESLPLKKELAERDAMIADLMDDLESATKERDALRERLPEASDDLLAARDVIRYQL